MICSVFDELCKVTSAKALKEMPNESGRYLLFKGVRVYGNEETQEYSLFYLFNAIDVNAGLKEVDEIKTRLLKLSTLEDISLPNKVSLEEVRSSISGLLQTYEFVIKIRLKGV